MTGERLDRRRLLLGLAGAACGQMLPFRGTSAAAGGATDATFLFTNDIHACRMAAACSRTASRKARPTPTCCVTSRRSTASSQEGWPERNRRRGQRPGRRRHADRPPLGLVVGGDMTDDGGGQIALPQRRHAAAAVQPALPAGRGAGQRAHAGLCRARQPRPRPGRAAGRMSTGTAARCATMSSSTIGRACSSSRRCRRPTTTSASDCYSWDWGGLHLVQTHRFAGDTGKAPSSSLRWLKRGSGDQRRRRPPGHPVPALWLGRLLDRAMGCRARAASTTTAAAAPHWWSEAERRALLDAR